MTSCKKCHAKVFTEWEKSFHAASLIGSPRTMATIASTIKDGLFKEYTHSGAKEVKELDVVVSLWHLPAGGELAKLEAGKGKFLFHESTKRVTVK